MKSTIEAMKQAIVRLESAVDAYLDKAIIDSLTAAIKQAEAQSVEPVARITQAGNLVWENTENAKLYGWTPLFTRPASATSPLPAERAALIEKLAIVVDRMKHGDAGIDSIRLVSDAMGMLAADAQEIEGWRADQRENLSNQVELQKQIIDLKAQQVAVPQESEAWKENLLKMFDKEKNE